MCGWIEAGQTGILSTLPLRQLFLGSRSALQHIHIVATSVVTLSTRKIPLVRLVPIGQVVVPFLLEALPARITDTDCVICLLFGCAISTLAHVVRESSLQPMMRSKGCQTWFEGSSPSSSLETLAVYQIQAMAGFCSSNYHPTTDKVPVSVRHAEVLEGTSHGHG